MRALFLKRVMPICEEQSKISKRGYQSLDIFPYTSRRKMLKDKKQLAPQRPVWPPREAVGQVSERDDRTPLCAFVSVCRRGHSERENAHREVNNKTVVEREPRG